MKKAFFLFLLICIFSNLQAFASSSSSSSDSTISDAEPYKSEEFPQWAKDARRFEIITVGSWPFTVLLTSVGYSVQNAISHQDINYFQNPFVKNDFSYSVDQQNAVILTSVLFSVGLGITDLICVLVKRNALKKKNASFESRNVTVTPMFQPDEEGGNLETGFNDSDYFFGTIENAVF